MQELVARKYYWETLRHNVEVYVRDCDVCLASKTVKHKPYGNLEQLPVPIHCWKDLSIDFVTGSIASICGLEEQWLWFNSSHCQSANKDGILQASADDNNCTCASKSHLRCCCLTPQFAQLYCQQPRLGIHIQVLVVLVLLLEYQTEALYHLPPSDWWPSWAAEQNNGSLP